MKRSGISYMEFIAEDLMIDLVTGEDGQNIILVIFSVMKQTQSEIRCIRHQTKTGLVLE